MEPIYWIILYVLMTFLCVAIAAKRGRSGLKYLLSLLIAPLPLMFISSWALGDSANKGTVVAILAFALPIVGIFLAVFGASGQQVAVSKGEYGDYKKCPFCAESVRKEAIKCRHCHSDLEATTN